MRTINYVQRRGSAVALAATLLCAPFVTSADTDSASASKAPVPSEAAVSPAIKMVREGFESGLGSDAAAKRAMGRKLLDEAVKEGDAGPTAERFALLREARDLATAGGDYALADEAARYTADHYQVELSELEGQIVMAAKQSRGPAAAAAAVPIAISLSSRAAGADDFAAAKKWDAVATLLADRSKDAGRVTAAHDNEAETRLHESDYTKAHDAEQTLKTHPGDGDALLAMGLHLAVDHENWERSLPLLAKGSDLRLAHIATMELEHPQGNGASKLADEWFDYFSAKGVPSNCRLAAAERAANWYETAIPDLKGLYAKRAAKRLVELEAALGSHRSVVLSQLDPKKVDGVFTNSGWGLGKDTLSQDGKMKLAVNGIDYPHGIGFNVGSDNGTVSIVYDLGQRYTHFSGLVGINDTAGDLAATLTYKIIGDDRELWVSKPIDKTFRLEAFNVSVANVKLLELRMVCDGSIQYAHSVWIEPRLSVR